MASELFTGGENPTVEKGRELEIKSKLKGLKKSLSEVKEQINNHPEKDSYELIELSSSLINSEANLNTSLSKTSLDDISTKLDKIKNLLNKTVLTEMESTDLLNLGYSIFDLVDPTKISEVHEGMKRLETNVTRGMKNDLKIDIVLGELERNLPSSDWEYVKDEYSDFFASLRNIPQDKVGEISNILEQIKKVNNYDKLVELIDQIQEKIPEGVVEQQRVDNHLLPTEVLNDGDIFAGIGYKVKSVESSNIADILEKVEGINIDISGNIDAKAWDDFFEDLKSNLEVNIKGESLDELNTVINKFKESPFYNQSLELGKAKKEIDDAKNTIKNWIKEGQNESSFVPITIMGETFSTPKEAITAIYKDILILDEVSKKSQTIMGSIFGLFLGIPGTVAGFVGNIALGDISIIWNQWSNGSQFLAISLGMAHINTFMSARRNVRDYFTVKFGDDAKKGKLNSWLNKYAGEKYLDITEGGSVYDPIEATGQKEYQKRKRVIDIFKSYYYDNIEVRQNLIDIEKSRLQSDTKTFWLELNRILKGEGRYSLARGVDIAIKPIMFESEIDVKIGAENMQKNGKDALSLLYKSFNHSKSSIGELSKTIFLDGVYLDLQSNNKVLSGSINGTESTAYLEEFLNKISLENGRIITEEKLMEELYRIREGYVTKLDMIETLDGELAKLNNKKIITLSTDRSAVLDLINFKKSNIIAFEKMVSEGRWNGSKQKFEKVIEEISKLDIKYKLDFSQPKLEDFINSKEETKSETTSGLEQAKIDNFRDNAKVLGGNIKESKEVVEGEFFKNIKDYTLLNGTIDDNTEKDRTKVLEEYKKMINENKLSVNKDKVKRDLYKISQGYLVEYEILKKLNDEIKNHLGNTPQDKERKNGLETFRNQVLSGQWEGKVFDLTTTITSILGNPGNPIPNSILTIDPNDIKTTIENGEKWSKVSVKKDDGSFKAEFERKTFETDVKIRVLSEQLNGRIYDGLLVERELNKLFATGNGYTRGHFLSLVENILNGGVFAPTVLPNEAEQNRLDSAEYPDRNTKNHERFLIIEREIGIRIGSIEREKNISKKDKLFKELKPIFELYKDDSFKDLRNTTGIFSGLKSRFDIIEKNIDGEKTKSDDFKKQEKDKIKIEVTDSKTTLINKFSDIESKIESLKSNKDYITKIFNSSSYKLEDKQKAIEKIKDKTGPGNLSTDDILFDIESKMQAEIDRLNDLKIEEVLKRHLTYNDLPKEIKEDPYVKKYYSRIGELSRASSKKLVLDYTINPIEKDRLGKISRIERARRINEKLIEKGKLPRLIP